MPYIFSCIFSKNTMNDCLFFDCTNLFISYRCLCFVFSTDLFRVVGLFSHFHWYLNKNQIAYTVIITLLSFCLILQILARLKIIDKIHWSLNLINAISVRLALLCFLMTSLNYTFKIIIVNKCIYTAKPHAILQLSAASYQHCNNKLAVSNLRAA